MGQTYRDLVVWQKSMDLVVEVYELSRSFPRAEAFGLTAQLRSAVVSIPSNISEGQGRLHRGDFRHHLSIARGSLASEAGGLSGAPLKAPANTICRRLFLHVGRRVPIVGVGGIFTAEDAYERIRSGATLVQLYTALIYEGPGVVARIVDGLAERLARDGFSSASEAIGVDAAS